MKYLNPKRYIKSQKAVKILKEHDQEVTHEQAELILAKHVIKTKKVSRIEPHRRNC